MTASYKRTVSRWFGIFYSIDDVKTFVKANMLTKQEFQEITGEDYME